MYDPRNLLERFLLAKEAAGLAPTTLRWYGDQVRLYLAHCQTAACDVFAPACVEAFLVAQRQAGLSPATLDARYRALMAWFNWCEDADDIDCPPSPIGSGRKRRIPRPKVGKHRVRHVTLAEYRQLLASIPLATWIDHRDYAIMQVLFWCGLRRSECANLWASDVDFGEGVLHVRAGKGDKDRDVPMAGDVQSAILAYLTARPDWPGPELWLGENVRTHVGVGEPLRSNGVRLMLERRCRAAGMRRLNAHAWRHGFAMAMLNNGADLSSISSMLGHGSVKVTADIYARWVTTGLKREYAEAAQRIRASD